MLSKPAELKLFDSFLKQAVTVKPTETVIPGKLRIYHCGPTVYFYPHIGNLQGAWLADTLVKTAEMAGWEVEYVENITDVGHLVGDGDDGQNISGSEDKMEKAARRDNKKVEEIVEHYTGNYRQQAAALGLNLPVNRLNPKATEYIEQQMVLALKLLNQKRAYLLDDGIYFDSEANHDLEVPFKLFKKSEDQTATTAETPRYYTAGGVILNQKNQVVLVSQITHGRPELTTYSLPKGRIEEGESKLVAAHREISEETGINPNSLKLINFLGSYTRTGNGVPNILTEMNFYLFQAGEELVLNSQDPNNQAFWFNLEEAIQKISHPADKQFLRKIQTELNRILTETLPQESIEQPFFENLQAAVAYKPTVLIVHGGVSFGHQEMRQVPLVSLEEMQKMEQDSNFAWHNSVLQKLRLLDYEAYLVPMPNPLDAIYPEWSERFKQTLSQVWNDKLILVGHSLGGCFLQRFLAENEIWQKVKQLNFIAPTLSEGSFKVSHNWDKLAEIKSVNIFHSEDDSIVPYAEGVQFHKLLPDSRLISFKDRDHFNQNGSSFDELVEQIKNLGPKNTQIKLITFDIDGVLTRFKVWGKSFEKEYGVTQEQLDEFYLENRELWHGVGDLKERLLPYLQKWNVPLSVEKYLEYWFTKDWEPFTEVWDMARKLKEMGYKIAIASAQEPYRREFLRQNYLPADLFDYFFFTSEIGYTKGDSQFWENIFIKADVKPEEVVHIDDSEAVCQAAEQNGVNSILYVNGNTDLALELEKLLGITLKNYTGREIKNTTKNPADFALWKFVEENSLQKWRFADYEVAYNLISNYGSVFKLGIFEQYQELIEAEYGRWEQPENLDEYQTPLERVVDLFVNKIALKWGCPGWHSECVAMICAIFESRQEQDPRQFSFKDFVERNQVNLQPVIDIHLGGEDHIDVHHRNEILQSAALGFNLSRYWVHNRFVLVDGKKMSKSLGNVFMITGNYQETGFYSLQNPPLEIKEKFKVLNGFDPLAFRLMLFEQNYREQLNFTWDKLNQSQSRLFNIRKEAAKIKSFVETELLENKLSSGSMLIHFITEKVEQDETLQAEYSSLHQQWLEIVTDNLNFSKLLEFYQSGLNELSNQIKELDGVSFSLLKVLIDFDQELLKLRIFNFAVSQDILDLSEQRWKAKQEKEYNLADELRKKIDALGWQIDDYSWGWGVWWRGEM
ncbi:MAG: hypothetical protein OHK0017_06170 [Patescibacteria group bacterium]